MSTQSDTNFDSVKNKLDDDVKNIILKFKTISKKSTKIEKNLIDYEINQYDEELNQHTLTQATPEEELHKIIGEKKNIISEISRLNNEIDNIQEQIDVNYKEKKDYINTGDTIYTKLIEQIQKNIENHKNLDVSSEKIIEEHIKIENDIKKK